jgi:hypothetical protein
MREQAEGVQILIFTHCCSSRSSIDDCYVQSFDSKSPDRKPLYESALLETDARKLPERIATARSAILDRIEESLTHPLPGEHRAMDEALRHLRRLAEMTARAGQSQNQSSPLGLGARKDATF